MAHRKIAQSGRGAKRDRPRAHRGATQVAAGEVTQAAIGGAKPGIARGGPARAVGVKGGERKLSAGLPGILQRRRKLLGRFDTTLAQRVRRLRPFHPLVSAKPMPSPRPLRARPGERNDDRVDAIGQMLGRSAFGRQVLG